MTGWRIYLSPPDVGPADRDALLAAFDSGWIAPLGPEVDAFEVALAQRVGVPHAVALSSGTAGLHLALLVAGVNTGDEVVVPTLTFSATANAVTYLGARPTFVDVDPHTWQLDPTMLEELLAMRAAAGRLPAAVVTVDLYGQCCDYDRIEAACNAYDVVLIEDAAEALGATYGERNAASFGRCGVLSFNGNKVITTSGGGAVLTDDQVFAARIRHLATQARDPAPHYQHSEVGFNYRLSNLLAGLGRSQLSRLDERIARRRVINQRYRAHLSDLPGVQFMPHDTRGDPTWWLTCITIDPTRSRVDRDEVRLALAERSIEARPVWKPMHLQPVFADCTSVGGEVAATLFAAGLCLPSGSNLTDQDVDEIAEVIQVSHGG